MLTPLAVGPGQPFPYISGLSQSLAVRVSDSETGEERSARVKVPEGLARFVSVGSEQRLVPQEQVIAHFLPWLFPGMEVLEHAYFRVTRDADFELSDEADDLLEAVETELRRRRFGDVVRLEVSTGVSRHDADLAQAGAGGHRPAGVSHLRPGGHGRRVPAGRHQPARAQVRAVDSADPRAADISPR